MKANSFFQTRRGGAPDPRASARSMVLARNGAVSTSQPLATQAALDVLRGGGNAFDAAVCAAGVLGVVEPYNTGIGGDCFALCWSAREDRLVGLNGSGRASAAASIGMLRDAGYAEMPERGIHTVTVPGAVDAWCTLLDRFGTHSLASLLAPAIELAENGFAGTEIVVHEWGLAAAFGFLQNDAARRCFAPGGEGPQLGSTVRFPDLARSLRCLGEGGRDVFYEGELAERIRGALAEEGGTFTAEDFARTRSEWVDPIGIDYRGYRLCEIPPNTQGITALIALGVLRHFDLDRHGVGTVDALHLVIEAVKLAFADRDAHVADLQHMDASCELLLDDASLEQLAATIDPRRAAAVPSARVVRGSDTVYLTTADVHGNVVSFINSLYGPFGSGLVAGDTGIALQNRGRAFSLDPGHPNCLLGGKRPFHTLCPAMLLEQGRPRVSFGVMGGNVQAQAQVQFVTNLVDHGLNVQEALDAPRFHYIGGQDVVLEPSVDDAVIRGLVDRGHRSAGVVEALVRGGFGGGQAIAVHPETGTYWAGSDRRKDGAAAGY